MINKMKMRELRESKKISVARLAEKVGCSDAFISYLENGKKEPTARTLFFLAKALNCTMDDLYTEDQ